MKSLRNKVQLIGNLGADPEILEIDRDKKRQLWVYQNIESGFGWMVLDPLDRIIAQAIRAELDDVDDGEVLEFQFKKVMMSQAEIDRLPDV